MIIQDGQFKTTSRFHDYLPIESEYAYIRIVKPLAWGRHEPKHKPMVLVLPGTGEKGFGRRYDGVCLPLARLGVASIVALLLCYYVDLGGPVLWITEAQKAEWM